MEGRTGVSVAFVRAAGVAGFVAFRGIQYLCSIDVDSERDFVPDPATLPLLPPLPVVARVTVRSVVSRSRTESRKDREVTY